MRQVLSGAAQGDEPARLALAVYLHRLCGLAGSMAAALNGLDTLVFTGGVGERAPDIRRWAGAGLGFLGVSVDSARNQRASGDTEITDPGAAVRTFVIAAREDLEIARQVREILGP
jgi:acetate kinase